MHANTLKGSITGGEDIDYWDDHACHGDSNGSELDLPYAGKLVLPGDSLDLIFRKTCPYKDIDDYFASKNVEKQVRYTTKWEISRNCSSVHLINAQKQLRDTGRLLSRFRKQAKIKRVLFDKKWSDLEREQMTLKAQFLKFNKFVRENQEKRDRALKKIADERELQEKRVLDIELMQDSFKKTVEIKSLMEKKVKEHRMFEDYLTSVVIASGSYKNTNDILYRYESLIESRSNLSAKQQESLMALENARSAMTKLIEEKSLTLVGYVNQLSSLQERYELAYMKCLQWESTVSKIQDICIVKMAGMQMVRDSIDYIFTDMSKRKNLRLHLKVAANDYETKLTFIKRTLRDFCHVLNKYKPIRCK